MTLYDHCKLITIGKDIMILAIMKTEAPPVAARRRRALSHLRA